jgi:hypothetical protein
MFFFIGMVYLKKRAIAAFKYFLPLLSYTSEKTAV